MEIDVDVVPIAFTPTFLTNAIAPRAWGAFPTWTAAPRRMARGRPHRRVGARLDLAMLSWDVLSSVILLPSPPAGADQPQRAGRQQRFSAESCRHFSDVPISWAGRRAPWRIPYRARGFRRGLHPLPVMV